MFTSSNTKSLMIQSLRGVAVIGVILFHSIGYFFPGGYLGVDLFFVISGFVLAPQLLDIVTSRSDVRDKFKNYTFFVKRRFLRILPGLASCLVVTIPILLFLLPLEALKRMMNQAISSILFISNFTAVQNNGNYFSPAPNPFLHTWSLSTEIQLYAITPILFVMFFSTLNYFVDKQLKWGLRVIVLILFLFSLFDLTSLLTDQVFNGRSIATFSYFNPINRIWEFVSGIVIWSESKSFKSRLGTRFSGSIILFIFFPIFLMFVHFSHEIYFSFVIVIFLSLVLFFFSDIQVESFGRVFKLFSWFGDRSYSIYLFHLPIAIILRQYWNSDEENLISSIMFASLVILLSSTFGFFNHKYIEETFRVKDNPDVIFSKRNIGTLVTLVTSVVMVLLLALMVANKYILRQSEYFSKNPIKPWQVETGCTFFLDNTSGARNLCNYGFQNGRFQIVLIGDSHAATLTDSLIDLANKYEFELYVSTQAGCPFLTSKTNLESILSTIVSDQCIKRNNWLTKEIGKLAPEYTIYVNRSTQDYLTEKSPDTRYLFFKTIQANLAQLESKSVLFIGPNPEITVPNSLGAYLKGQVAQWNKTPKLDDVILRDLESSHKLRYVSLSKLLCPADSCSSTRISSIILADRDHLSSYGANLVTRHILQIIESMRF